MFRPRWRKVIRDLWLNRARTILVVLSVAVGVFSVGVIGTSRFVLSEQLNASYMATNPTAALLMTSTAFDKKMVESIRNMPEVAEAEGRRNVGVRLKLGENEWRSMQLNIIDDFDDIRVDKIYHEEGQWPPGKQEILVERGALGLTNAEIGDEVIIRAPNGKERVVRIVGTAHDLYAQMYTLSGFAYGYATFDVLEWLGEPRDFNDLRFTVAENSMDREHITIVAQDVQDKLEKGGVGIFFNMAMVPGQHPLNFIIEPMLAMLGVLGLLALILSAFLVINMISALLTQQRKQIGVMKAIGATASQLLVMYFVNVILLGVLSLVISVPLGMLGAQMFSEGMAGMLNFDIDNFYIPPPVLIAQIVVALFVPVVASTYPILMGVRVTVREAISDYGIGKAFGQSIIDRILIKLRFQFLTRPTIISLRNTFRRKARLGLTLATLVIGGTIFISVFTVQDSLESTLDMFLSYYNYDVAFQLARPYRTSYLEEEVLKVPGVTNMEGWFFGNMRRVRPDGTESDNIIFFSPPADTKLVNPTVIEGRWLIPEDDNAVVVNTMFLNNEDDVKLGDTITLKIQGEEEEWHVVGIMVGGNIMSTIFTNYKYISQKLHRVNESEWIFTQTTDHSPEFRKAVQARIEEHFGNLGVRTSMGVTVDEDIQSAKNIFALLVALMLVMATLIAVVGGLGLMGTMSINVLERTREVGVMRAIGAGNRAVLKIVMIEGVLIGVLSWFIAMLVALPVSKLVSDMIGQLFMSAALDYTFSYLGATIWLVMVIVLAMVSSLLPAWSAVRLTVREVLSYE